MTKHDIRLRRHSLTSRSIQKHKNYRQLMERHRQRRRTRKLFGLVGVLVLLLILFGLLSF